MKHFNNHPLSALNSFKIGGTAEEIYFPENDDDLIESLSTDKPLTILGNGSNVLISDTGVQGRVICTRELHKQFIDIQGNLVTLGAGVLCPTAAQAALAAGLSGLEWGVAVPGNMGGAAVMNASFLHGIGIKQCLEGVELIDFNKQQRIFRGTDIFFKHRWTSLQNEKGVVTKITLRLLPGEHSLIALKMKAHLAWKRKNQPLREPSAGCIFKNVDTLRALMARHRRLRIGQAIISPKDPRFIINSGTAKAMDVFALIKLIQWMAPRNVDTELEIKLLGDFKNVSWPASFRLKTTFFGLLEKARTLVKKMAAHLKSGVLHCRRHLSKKTSKVFNVGLNRSGSTSLTKAMTILGLKSIHYMCNEKRIADIVRENITRHKKLLDGIDHYDFFSDFEGQKFFRELDAQYPNSKFILTTRELHSWLESREKKVKMNQQDPSYKYDFLKVDKERWQADREMALLELTEYFKDRPSSFLIIDICAGDGWEKLCRFLSLPLPSEPFPHLHKS